MPEVQHKNLRPGILSGNHVIQDITVADPSARAALSLVDDDVGRVARQISDRTFWILNRVTGGVEWRRIDFEGLALSSTNPTAIAGNATASPGADAAAAHGDHVHPVTVGTPVSIGGTGAANDAGSGAALALANHVHALATADRTKLDALPSTAVTVDTATTPTTADAGAGAAGSGSAAAAVNHKHQVSTSTPVAVGQANAAGSGTALALATHVHDHGAQPLGTGNQHAAASTTVAGFLSAADKTKLDGIATGAAALSNVAATAVGATAAVGPGTAAAREGHVHNHGALGYFDTAAGARHHTLAVGGAADGFMSATDKTKLDGIATGANTIGAASSTDNAIARFDGTTGKTLQNCGVSIDDSNNLNGVASMAASGALSGTSCTVTGTLSGASLGGAVGSIPFVTIGNSGALAGERALTAGQGITITDGGANGAVTVATNFDPATKANLEWTVTPFATASLSVILAHRNNLLVANMAGGLAEQVAVLPNDATLNLPVGFTATLLRNNAWRCSFDWLSGQTIVIDPNRLAYCRDVGSSITAVKIAANTWWISGDLADDVPDVP